MTKLKIVALATALLASTLQARAGTIGECRKLTDSLARLTCYDAIEESGTTSAAAPAPTAGKSTVTLVSAELRLQNKDFDKEVFSPRIEFVPTFRNSSKKTVVGISHILTVTDAFGDKILENKDKLDIRIGPGATARSPLFYIWEDNQFISNEAYDKLLGPVTNGTAKATSVVTGVVYSDGTVDAY